MESLEHRCCPRICAGYHPPVAQSATPPAPQNHPRDTSRGAWWCGGHSGAVMFGHTLPCHCEGVRSTLETLAYDCGNPGQYVCGRTPAVLFYLLDRHALLAMTVGSKCGFLNALPHPPSCSARHPPPRTTHANYVCAGPGVAVGILICHCPRTLSPLSFPRSVTATVTINAISNFFMFTPDDFF